MIKVLLVVVLVLCTVVNLVHLYQVTHKPYYEKGETLDPNCRPTDVRCTVR